MNKNIQQHAEDFGNRGFHTVVPDLYRGKVAADAGEAHHLLSGLDWGRAVSDIRGAAQFLKQNGAKKVGVMGFCMGGALVIACSTSSEVDAGAVFYGIPDLSKIDLDKIHVPLQLHFGKLDQSKGFSDPESAANLEKKLKEHGKEVELFMYDADHAFNNRDRPEVYKKEESERAFERVEAFFKKALA